MTLFLSIEVSKAMQAVSDAQKAQDSDGERYAQTMVDYFTSQLNESNPILTQIADAMTSEGRSKEQMEQALKHGNEDAASRFEKEMNRAAQAKQAGNTMLMECSAKYNALMKDLREAR